MAHVENAFLGAVVMLALWTLVGSPIALRLAEPPTCWLWAPALGWAVYNVIVLPLVGWIGMGRATVLVVTAVFAVVGLVACFLPPPAMPPRRPALALPPLATAPPLLSLPPPPPR